MDEPDNDPLDSYYTNVDQASEAPQSQPTTTTSVDSTDDGMSTHSYRQTTARSQPQQAVANMPTSTMGMPGYASGASMYNMSSTGGLGQTTFQTSHPTWPAQDQNAIFGSSDPAGLTTNPSMLNPFEYQQYREMQQASTTDVQPMLFGGSYAMPPPPGGSLGFPYGIDNSGRAVGMGSDTTGFSSGTGSGSTPPSSLGTTTPASFTSGSSTGPYSANPGSVIGALPERGGRSRGSGSQQSNVRGESGDVPHAKRTKRTRRSTVTRPPAQHRASFSSEAVSPRSPSLSASGQPSSSRATASDAQRRTSASKAEATDQDPVTKGPHTVVEKQYRNRLNAQFEGLMNALPENLRAQGAAGQAYGELGIVEAADRRPSKAEVLEMARQHIQSLEKERDTLERERNELLGNMDDLRDEYAKGAVARGQAESDWPVVMRQKREESRESGKDKSKGRRKGKGKAVDHGNYDDDDDAEEDEEDG